MLDRLPVLGQPAPHALDQRSRIRSKVMLATVSAWSRTNGWDRHWRRSGCIDDSPHGPQLGVARTGRRALMMVPIFRRVIPW